PPASAGCPPGWSPGGSGAAAQPAPASAITTANATVRRMSVPLAHGGQRRGSQPLEQLLVVKAVGLHVHAERDPVTVAALAAGHAAEVPLVRRGRLLAAEAGGVAVPEHVVGAFPAVA